MYIFLDNYFSSLDFLALHIEYKTNFDKVSFLW